MEHTMTDTTQDAEARGKLEAKIGHRLSDCPYSGPRLRAAWWRGFTSTTNR